MDAKTQSALQAKMISPGITVDDLTESIAFYEGLGFGVGDRWEQDGVLTGVMLQAGTAMFGLSQDDWARGRDRVKGLGIRIWIGTDQNIDELAARAKDSGITLDMEPHDTDWGARAFEVTDPTGFKLTISTMP
jgi:uncharacterized glyoxalase superfamily protein PhnB